MEFYRNLKSMEFRVGLFSLIAIVLLIWGYMWLTDAHSKKDYTQIRIKFADIGNLEKGSSVSILGVKRGRIEELQIQEDGVVLSMLVKLDFPLKQDAQFLIKETDLMGSAQVWIVPGKSSVELDYSKVHQGHRNYGMGTLISELSNLIFDVKHFLAGFSDDDEARKELAETLSSVHEIVTKLNTSLDSNLDNFSDLVKNTSAMTGKINNIIERYEPGLDNTIAGIDTSLVEFNTTMKGLNELTANLNEIVVQVKADSSTVNKLITEEELYDNLLRSSARLDSLLKDVKENPKKYFSIKIL